MVWSVLSVLLGTALAVAGVALISVPVAMVVAGAALAAFGLLYDTKAGE